MAAQGYQAQAPAMPAAGDRAGRAPTTGMSQPKPRRGQIKEKILKDVVAAVAGMAAGLVARADKNAAGGGGGLPVAADKNAGGGGLPVAADKNAEAADAGGK